MAAVALLSPLFFFSSSITAWKGRSFALTALQEVLFPIEYVWNKVENFVVVTGQRYIFLTHTAEENEKLKKKLAILETKVMDYEEQVKERDRLRELLGFVKKYDKQLVAAEILGLSSDLAFQAVRIDRGSGDGIQVGMPVLAAGGAVGKIIRTGRRFSDVQLLADSNFSLDILVQRTRVRGVLKGLGKKCRLQLHQRSEIRIGDTVITSGMIGGFPKGLPVGRVVKIRYESDNVFQIVTVEPWVDYERLEEVVILLNSDPEIAKISSIGGNSWIGGFGDREAWEE